MNEEYYSRSQAFGEGRYGTGQSVGLLQSLESNSARQNSSAIHSYTPTSVLNQWKMSGNGMSARDAERMLPGMSGMQLPNMNAASGETLMTQNNLRMAGGLPL